MAITKAPFETFPAYDDRSKLDAPYNDAFLAECRQAALRYDKEDVFLRGILLSDLQRAVPMHFRGNVFAGISFVYVS
jgi:hypothetical protein